MRAILLETSSPHAEVALATAEQIVRRQHLSMARQHARDLAPALQNLLTEEGWSPASITHLGVDIGPGSYTGLRVGVVTAKMFAYATGAKVVGVDAMTLLAIGSPGSVRSIHTIVDAQQNQVYACRFRRDDAEAAPMPACETEVVPVDTWAKSLQEGDYVTGPGLTKFAHLLPAGVHASSPGKWSPSVDAMLAEIHRRSISDHWDDPWKLNPLYLRASSAQIRWDAKPNKAASAVD